MQGRTSCFEPPSLSSVTASQHLSNPAQVAAHFHLTAATPPPTPCSSKYYKRGSTETMMPKPNWLRVVRLGQSAAQQVGAAGLGCSLWQEAGTG